MTDHNKLVRVSKEATPVIEQLSDDTGIPESAIVSELITTYSEDYKRMKAEALVAGEVSE